MHSWTSYHIFYGHDRRLLARRLLDDLLGALWREGSITRCFFINYSLGGPHVRLRLCSRLEPDRLDEVVRDRCAKFFAEHPSTRSQSTQEILEGNRELALSDPQAEASAHYANDSVHRVEFVPETDRYGGSDLIDLSLALFQISSLYALDALESLGTVSKTRSLPAAIPVLLLHLLGFSRSLSGARDLLQGMLSYWGQAEGVLIARGDQVFESQPEGFVALVAKTLVGLEQEADETPHALLVEGSARLSLELDGLEPTARSNVLVSHLHMTGNRLGLSAAEECYLGRILWRALRQYEAQELLAEPKTRDRLSRLERARPLERLAAQAGDARWGTHSAV